MNMEQVLNNTSMFTQSIRDNKDIQNEILMRRGDIFQQNLLRTAIPANILCASIVFGGLYHDEYLPMIGIWYGATVLVQIMRLCVSFFLKQNYFRYKVHLILTCVSALSWSVAGTLLMSQSDPVGQMIIIIIIAGVTAGGIQTLQSSWVTNLTFIALSILPLSLWVLLKGGATYDLLGIAMLGYAGFMVTLALRGYKLLTSELSLRYENLELVDDLSSRTKNLEKLNRTLQESENRFRLSFNNAAIGMALVSLTGQWLKVNPSICKIVGYSEEELLKIDFQTITYADDLEADLNYVRQLLDGTIENYNMEKRYIHKNGNLVWILLSVSLVRDLENKPVYFIAQIQSINAQKEAEDALKTIAYHDPLTGLANRTLLEHLFNKEMAHAKRQNTNLAVFFIDLDHFKRINDKMGHEAGDTILKVFAERALHAIRGKDILARLGGDEFILIVTDISDQHAVETVAKKIYELMATPVDIKGTKISISLSIGISLFPENGRDIENLMKRADSALYQVKKEGRNAYLFYTPEMQNSSP